MTDQLISLDKNVQVQLKQNKRTMPLLDGTGLFGKYCRIFKMKKILPLLIFLLAGCMSEKMKPVETACKKFFREHPEKVQKYFFAECLDSTWMHYELALKKNIAFLAKIEGGEIRTKQVWEYSRKDFLIHEISDWIQTKKSENFDFPYKDKKSIRADSNFGEFKNFVMDVERLDENEFEQKFEDEDSLANLFAGMRGIFFLDGVDWLRKLNDSLLFIRAGTGSCFKPEIFNIHTKKSREVLNFCAAVPEIGIIDVNRMASDVYVSDSSLFVKFLDKYWIYYDFLRDSLAFHMDVEAEFESYFIEFYRAPGDTVHCFDNGKSFLFSRAVYCPELMF